VLTGTKSLDSSIVTHHLFSCQTHPTLIFSILNGIPLTTDIHKKFHKFYSNQTTPKDFIHFIKKLGLNSDRERELILWIEFLNIEMLKKL
jgi:hypothetical protein